MWRWGNRRERDRIEQMAQDQRQLAAKLDGLLKFFATQGAEIESAAPDAVSDVPPDLIAATRARLPRPGGEPVKVTIGEGQEVIAVVDDQGDPAELWAAIRGLAAR